MIEVVTSLFLLTLLENKKFFAVIIELSKTKRLVFIKEVQIN